MSPESSRTNRNRPPPIRHNHGIIRSLFHDEDRLAWALTTLTVTVVTVGCLAGVGIWTLVGYVAIATALNFFLLFRSVREERRSEAVRPEPSRLNPYQPPE